VKICEFTRTTRLYKRMRNPPKLSSLFLILHMTFQVLYSYDEISRTVMTIPFGVEPVLRNGFLWECVFVRRRWVLVVMVSGATILVT